MGNGYESRTSAAKPSYSTNSTAPYRPSTSSTDSLASILNKYSKNKSEKPIGQEAPKSEKAQTCRKPKEKEISSNKASSSMREACSTRGMHYL